MTGPQQQNVEQGSGGGGPTLGNVRSPSIFNRPVIITIDGPGASGKGHLAHELSRYYGLPILHSGLLYRGVGYLMRQAEARGESLDEAALSKLAATMCLEYRPGADVSPTDIVLNGVVLPSAALLSEEASQAASRCGAEPAVRAALIPHQRAWGAAGCVCEGRDMGTVIFPTADFKIYLTASLEERAVRRYREHLRRAGEPGTEVSRESAGFKAVLESLRARDERDAQRSAAPLLRANDAQVIDSSGIGPSEVLQRATERIDALARERGLFVDTGALSSPSPREADIGDP